MTANVREAELVLRGGLVGTADGCFTADVAIADGRIVAIGEALPAGLREIDARDRYVLPGGVDAHAHIDQISASGIRTADDWHSATSAAALGGTTSVLAFAAQHRDQSLAAAVEDYEARAASGAVIDYGFHLMITNPSAATLEHDLPAALAAGHRSVKVFMSYDALFLGDEQLLDVMAITREHGGLICVHAESHGMLTWMGKRMIAAGDGAPRFQPKSHPRLAELDAIERIIRMSDLTSQRVMIFHVSTAEGAAAVRTARGRGSLVVAETCPQYLFLHETVVDRPLPDAARFIFSPPPRLPADQDALWRAMALGDISVLSSDHAPYAITPQAKLRAGPDANFRQIPNGVPGIELRQALIFDAMVAKGRAGIEAFIALTATNPARIYGLERKGRIAIGADADIAIWDPTRERVLSDAEVNDRTGFTPYAGRTITGAPETVIRRGEVIVESCRLAAAAGSGRLLRRPAP